MTLPNLITIARLLGVPVVVWLIADGHFATAFWLFVLCGVSDGIDGYIARRFDMQSELGAYLDPIADKALLVAVYLSLLFAGMLPVWLVVAVTARDLLIVGAVNLSWIMDRPVEIRPFLISKATTVAQIVTAATILGKAAFGVRIAWMENGMVLATAILTLLSAAAYLRAWIRHMAAADRVP
ncbi:CDP-alcohol phosphatidyltransferase family protein [Stappia stellulata]|uniref:CDP-alcohol phosphatidyltransferase family protein n=1 Tax=Stappia stellulata TaxID=71235 RepID=UPI00040B2B2B|nr:CDP-alcohol phosphatidyltransferase family protein [Stappia stellulata]